MMILEMTAFYKKLGMTLSDALEKLYEAYGFYGERTLDFYMEGLDGIAKRRTIMSNLRNNPPVKIGGYKIAKIGDYKTGTVLNTKTGATEPTGQPSSDVLYYTLDSDDKIIVRPSGTEPKIKIYILLHAENEEKVKEKIRLYEQDARKMMES